MDNLSIVTYGNVSHLHPRTDSFDPVGIFARGLTLEQLKGIKYEYDDGVVGHNGGSPLIIYHQLKETLGSGTRIDVTHIRLPNGLVTVMPYLIYMQERQGGMEILRRKPTIAEVEAALVQVGDISAEINETKQAVPTLGKIEVLLQAHLRALATDSLEGRV